MLARYIHSVIMNLAYYLQIEYIIHSTNGLNTVQKLNSTDQDKKNEVKYSDLLNLIPNFI